MMFIKDYKLHSQQELIDVIRNTYLLGDSEVFPFSSSKIYLQNVTYKDVVPTQTFVLTQQIEKIKMLYKAFLANDIDITKNNGFISFKMCEKILSKLTDPLNTTTFNSKDSVNTNGIKYEKNGKKPVVLNGSQDKNYVLTPPIIEVVGGVPLIIDGQHRITFNGDNNMDFTALFIEDIPPEYYPYQLPLADGWNSVQRFETTLPEGFVRKERRYPNGTHKHYFREYPFPGIIKLAREHTGK